MRTQQSPSLSIKDEQVYLDIRLRTNRPLNLDHNILATQCDADTKVLARSSLSSITCPEGEAKETDDDKIVSSNKMHRAKERKSKKRRVIQTE